MSFEIFSIICLTTELSGDDCFILSCGFKFNLSLDVYKRQASTGYLYFIVIIYLIHM